MAPPKGRGRPRKNKLVPSINASGNASASGSASASATNVAVGGVVGAIANAARGHGAGVVGGGLVGNASTSTTSSTTFVPIGSGRRVPQPMQSMQGAKGTNPVAPRPMHPLPSSNGKLGGPPSYPATHAAPTAQRVQPAQPAHQAQQAHQAQHVQQAQHAKLATATAAIHTTNNHHHHHHRNTKSKTTANHDTNSSTDNDEYARFMRSIMNGDDASIMTFRTLQSATAGVGKGGAVGTVGTGVNLGTIVGDDSMIGSAFDDLDDASYHLTSEEEDDDDDDENDDRDSNDENDEEEEENEEGDDHSDDDDDDDDEENDGEEKKDGDTTGANDETPKKGSKRRGKKGTIGSPSSTGKKSTKKGALPPTPQSGSSTLVSLEGRDEDFDHLNVFGEIEGLMEEDLEAAVATLLQSDPLSSPSGGGELSLSNSWQGGGGIPGGAAGMMARSKNGVAGAAASAVSAAASAGIGKAAVAGSQQQKAITTPGQSTKKKKSTTTVVTTPSPGMGMAMGSPLSASNSSHSNGMMNPPVATGPVITGDQLRRLRETMARHHQLLLQQATLAVRAAYVQKVQKDNSTGYSESSKASSLHVKESVSKKQKTTAGNTTTDNSLPPSRLNSRSLTFCTPEQRCTYENDFFSGETADELAEVLDGAVGMLQDLEQNWKDAVRNSIQLSFAPSSNGSKGTRVPQPHGGRRRLLPTLDEKSQFASNARMPSGSAEQQNGAVGRPLTRSAFTKTLREREMEMLSGVTFSGESNLTHSGGQVRQRVSVFDVRGLGRLRETFSAIDNSVNDIQMGRKAAAVAESGRINILNPKDVSSSID